MEIEISIWDLIPGDVAGDLIIRSVERLDYGDKDIRLNIVAEWTDSFRASYPYVARIIRLQYHSSEPKLVKILNRLPRME